VCLGVGGEQEAVRRRHPFIVGCVSGSCWRWHEIGGPQVVVLSLLLHLVRGLVGGGSPSETTGPYKGWVLQWDYAQELFVTFEVGA
jgi:hypothetical protein